MKEIKIGDKSRVLYPFHITNIGNYKILGETERYTAPSGGKKRRVIGKCVCGKIKVVHWLRLKSGKIKSCGCISRSDFVKSQTSHGMKGTRIYSIRCGMKGRCDNKAAESYPNYGGRGICYDKRRSKFESFYQDMKDGYRNDLTIERINNDGNYEKDNCRWATKKEQNRNTRVSKEFSGKTLGEWSEETGINKSTLYYRIKRNNITIEEAINYPFNRKARKVFPETSE